MGGRESKQETKLLRKLRGRMEGRREGSLYRRIDGWMDRWKEGRGGGGRGKTEFCRSPAGLPCNRISKTRWLQDGGEIDILR